MNKVRIIGIVILVAGVLLISYFENDGIDFVSGILVGLGIGLVLTGYFFKNKNE